MLRPHKAKEMSAGGIIIPQAFQAALNQGAVVAKGPDTSDGWNVGDVLLYQGHTEIKVTLDGEEFYLVDEANVILQQSEGTEAAG